MFCHNTPINIPLRINGHIHFGFFSDVIYYCFHSGYEVEVDFFFPIL